MNPAQISNASPINPKQALEKARKSEQTAAKENGDG